MKKGSHKNQIIITTLALLLAVVGYISYDNRDTFMNAKDVLSTEIEAVNGKADTKESKECEDTQASDEVALETDSTEEILNAGETVLTSASTESEECVAQVKLGREQVRSKNKEALQKIIDDAEVSETEKKSAVDAMVKLTENAQMEEDAQMMLEAKGFKNAVVSLSDECCDVIVGKEDVTDEKQINKAVIWMFVCNFCAMELSILGLLAIAYVSKLASASVPMLVLVQNGVGAGILTPIISLLIILGAISTAVNMISGIVTRCVNAVERRMDSPEKKAQGHLGRNAVFTAIFTFLAFAIAQFGLMTVVKKGYAYLGYAAFITLFVPFVVHAVATKGKEI